MRNDRPIIGFVPLGIHSSGHVIACHIFRPAGQGRKKPKTLDGAKYVEIIENECVPRLREVNPMYPGTLRGMRWQQDGAGKQLTRLCIVVTAARQVHCWWQKTHLYFVPRAPPL